MRGADRQRLISKAIPTKRTMSCAYDTMASWGHHLINYAYPTEEVGKGGSAMKIKMDLPFEGQQPFWR